MGDTWWLGSAQTACCNPPLLSPSAGRWPQGAPVTVTISSAFSTAEREDIITAFQDWNAVSQTNGSGVTFVGFQTGNSPTSIANNQFVGYDPDLDLAGINHVSMISGPSGSYSYANMYLSDSIRNPMKAEVRRAYTRGLTRHETGHGFGLENAGNCPSSASIGDVHSG